MENLGCLPSHPQESFAGKAWSAVGPREMGKKVSGGVICGEVPGSSPPVVSRRLLGGLTAGHS